MFGSYPTYRRWLGRIEWWTGIVLIVWSVFILILPRTYYLKLSVGGGQVWVHLGGGRTALFIRDEGGEPFVHLRVGGFNDGNSVYGFSPTVVDIEFAGFEFVIGTYYKTKFSGSAIAVSWVYTAISGAWLLILARRHHYVSLTTPDSFQASKPVPTIPWSGLLAFGILAVVGSMGPDITPSRYWTINHYIPRYVLLALSIGFGLSALRSSQRLNRLLGIAVVAVSGVTVAYIVYNCLNILS